MNETKEPWRLELAFAIAFMVALVIVSIGIDRLMALR